MSNGETLRPDDLTKDELARLRADLGDPASPGYRENWDKWMALAAGFVERAVSGPAGDEDRQRGERIEDYIRENFAPPGASAPGSPAAGGAAAGAVAGAAAGAVGGQAAAGMGGGGMGGAGTGGAGAPNFPIQPGRTPSNKAATGLVSLLMIAFILITVLIGVPQNAASGANAVRVDLTGCSGSGTALTKSGAPLDQATAPSPKASRKYPFVVVYNGTVDYQGQSATLITNHHWHVSLFNIQVRSGGSPNGTHKLTSKGTEKVKDYLPIKLTGLFYISGSISGNGGSCAGDVWVKLAGSPVGSVLWILGLILIVIGVILLFSGRPSPRGGAGTHRLRRRPLTGLLGGLIGGAGFFLFLLSYSKVPYGKATIFIVPGVLVVLGLFWGLFGPNKRRNMGSA